jgi:hypothetical protein
MADRGSRRIAAESADATSRRITSLCRRSSRRRVRARGSWSSFGLARSSSSSRRGCSTSFTEVLGRAKIRRYVTTEEAAACVDLIRRDSVLVDDPALSPEPVGPDPDDEYLIDLARVARDESLGHYAAGNAVDCRDLFPLLTPKVWSRDARTTWTTAATDSPKTTAEPAAATWTGLAAGAMMVDARSGCSHGLSIEVHPRTPGARSATRLPEPTAGGANPLRDVRERRSTCATDRDGLLLMPSGRDALRPKGGAGGDR